jgi:hypothetical protein
MGDRANIYVHRGDEPGVYLYTHWNGYEYLQVAQRALAKGWRWTDEQYLTRIIFDVMTDGDHGGETGFGISAVMGDNGHEVLKIDVASQRVTLGVSSWSFAEFVAADLAGAEGQA